MMIKAYIAFSKILLMIVILTCSFRAEDSYAQTGDTIREKYFYYINSTPFNAEVFYRDTLLGLTPVRFFSDEKLSGKVTVKKNGYANEEFDLSDYNHKTGKMIFLKSLTGTEEKTVFKNKTTQFVKKRNLPGIIAASLLAVTTGTLSFNFKEKANDFYSQYVNSGNTNNLDKSKKFDVYFGISLAVMQVSVAGLIYFLFLE
ncbi:MAG: hypothetical protein HY959_10395 [Ignavibacteriae bacterium]|nr:hypothetical protein [Ignavibacteriota bacterium]